MAINKTTPKRNLAKFNLISLGCPKNLIDSEQTIYLLERAGYLFTLVLEEAEIILVNTCGFIKSSKEESVETILEAAQMKKKGACRKLVVMGCLAQLYRKQLLKEIPEIDAVIGTGDFPAIVEILNDLEVHKSITKIGKPLQGDELALPRHLCTVPHTAYLKISEGCDHLCSYCIIPRIRGKQTSRTIESIVEEAGQLAARGVKEINLIGQDLTDYGRDIYGKRRLPDLLRTLNEVEKIRWIRLLYTYPNYINDELIAAIAECEHVCKYIDVPLQHVSSSILKSMKRGGNRQKLTTLIQKLRDKVPGITIRTTFIVGYPGETRKDFWELLDFVKEMEIDRVGVFTFSREEGTPSYYLQKQVSKKVRESRQKALLDQQEEIIKKKYASLIGTEIEVQIDWAEQDKVDYLVGRTQGQAPDIDGVTYVLNPDNQLKVKPGHLVKAKVVDVQGYDIYSHILKILRK
jgi:ribosomal protein S12 methylthiotransferase